MQMTMESMLSWKAALRRQNRVRRVHCSICGRYKNLWDMSFITDDICLDCETDLMDKGE